MTIATMSRFSLSAYKLNGLLDLSLAENTGHALPLVANSALDSQSLIAVDQGVA